MTAPVNPFGPCSACIFGQPTQGKTPTGEMIKGIRCKRYPVTYFGGPQGSPGMYPTLPEDDWCGEFKPRLVSVN